MKFVLYMLVIFTITNCVYQPKIVFPNQMNPDEIHELEDQVLRLINDYRKALDLKPLQKRKFLNFYARQHSERMAKNKVPFGHTGFLIRSKEIAEKFEFPVTVGENVHYNNSLKISAQIAVVKWLSSKKHLENIENDFELTGIGIVQSTDGGFYFTQLFLGY